MTISMRNVATAGAIRSLRHGPVSLSPAVVAIVAKEDDAVDVVTTLAESVQAYRGVVPPAARKPRASAESEVRATFARKASSTGFSPVRRW